MPRNAFEISPDTRALANKLAEVSFGGTVSYSDLSTVIGRNVLNVRYLLNAARNLVLRENGAVFGSVRSVGLQRLEIGQTPGIGHTDRRKIRRVAKRSVKKMTAVMAKGNMENGVMLSTMNEIHTLGVIEWFSRDKNVFKAEDDKPVPVAVAARQMLDRLSK